MTTTAYQNPDSTRYNVSMQNYTCDPGICFRAGRECIEFWAIEVAWFIFCCVGEWALDQPIRVLSFLLGIVETSVLNIYRGRGQRTLSMFMTYILGRVHLGCGREDNLRRAAVIGWLGMSFSTLFWERMYWISVGYEGTLVIFLLGYLLSMALALQPQGRRRWLLRIGAVVVWGVGWGSAAVLYWLYGGTGNLLTVWLMLYEALFHRRASHGDPGDAPPTPNPSWQKTMRKRRSTESTEA